jgi:UPF0755 protein
VIRFFVFLLVLAAAAGGGYAWFDYHRYLETPVQLPAEGRVFTVERGWSARRLGTELEREGIIDKRHWFDVYARLSDRAVGIKSGEFRLVGPLTVPGLFDTFVRGQTIQYSHTIIEGSTWKQTLQRIAASDALVHTLGESVLASPEAVMEAIGYPGLHAEGQFFADTYAFPRGTTDVQYLKRAREMLDQVLTEEWEKRQDTLPLQTPYEALILASIVEKETAVPDERPLIAGVFVSRLHKRMRLQTDPTVIYGMGDSYDGNIRRRDLTTDTPYNTYTRMGLPPTPIAMVGREAIRAVMQPRETTALYFVARGDGSHQFSDTLEAHNAAVRKYQLGGK